MDSHTLSAPSRHPSFLNTTPKCTLPSEGVSPSNSRGHPQSMSNTKAITSHYSFAFVCAFFRIGSILVAFITSPLIFSFPLMNNFCAFALPEISLPKSSSLRMSVTMGSITR